MHRCLVVANRTLGGQQLLEHVRAALERGPVRIEVLVPVHPDEPDELAAQARLDAAVTALRELGAEAGGHVTSDEPIDAIETALGAGGFEEVVVCTLPQGLSRWLGLDLVGQTRRRAGVPVTHIETPAGLPARVTARAVRLSVYLGESDRHAGRPLFDEIVRRARAAGLAGATVVRGVEGFGASSVIHTSRLVSLSEDLPVIVTIIDTPERIEAFLPLLDELISEGLVVREPVTIVKYAGRAAPAAGEAS